MIENNYLPMEDDLSKKITILEESIIDYVNTINIQNQIDILETKKLVYKQDELKSMLDMKNDIIVPLSIRGYHEKGEDVVNDVTSIFNQIEENNFEMVRIVSDEYKAEKKAQYLQINIYLENYKRAKKSFSEIRSKKNGLTAYFQDIEPMPEAYKNDYNVMRFANTKTYVVRMVSNALKYRYDLKDIEQSEKIAVDYLKYTLLNPKDIIDNCVDICAWKECSALSRDISRKDKTDFEDFCNMLIYIMHTACFLMLIVREFSNMQKVLCKNRKNNQI